MNQILRYDWRAKGVEIFRGIPIENAVLYAI